MTTRSRLWFGPLAAAMLCIGLAGLALTVPGYSSVHQTVSEIGEIGSPARIPFAALLCGVAACLLLFATAVASWSKRQAQPRWAALFIAFMAVPAAGVGIFAYPDPLHNLFGVSELVGYQAPLVLALTWRRTPEGRAIAWFSAIMAGLVWVAILANLTTFHRSGTLWASIAPIYGLVQRALFASWFIWCAGVGLLLLKAQPMGRAGDLSG